MLILTESGTDTGLYNAQIHGIKQEGEAISNEIRV